MPVELALEKGEEPGAISMAPTPLQDRFIVSVGISVKVNGYAILRAAIAPDVYTFPQAFSMETLTDFRPQHSAIPLCHFL